MVLGQSFKFTPLGNLIVVLTLLLLVGRGLPEFNFFASPGAYIPFHILVEGVSIAIAFIVFWVCWRHRTRTDNGKIILLGVTFLAIGFIDIAHVLSFKGMPTLITPSSAEKAINFWLLSRFISLTAITGMLLATKAHWGSAQRTSVLLLTAFLVMLAYWIGFFHPEALPRTYIEGEGLTALKVGLEYVMSAAMAFGALRLLLRAEEPTPGNINFRLMAAAAWIQALAALFFSLYVAVTDLFNILGHVYKVIAFFMVYLAIKPLDQSNRSPVLD